MDANECRERFASARVARLATVGADGLPHLVPCTFALAADVLWTAVDAKPKRSAKLRRLDNIRANPNVALLVDAYDEDWSRLWWVRLDGVAHRVEGERECVTALAALQAKYDQYAAAPPAGPFVAVHPTRWTGWEGAGR